MKKEVKMIKWVVSISLAVLCSFTILLLVAKLW